MLESGIDQPTFFNADGRLADALWLVVADWIRLNNGGSVPREAVDNLFGPEISSTLVVNALTLSLSTWIFSALRSARLSTSLRRSSNPFNWPPACSNVAPGFNVSIGAGGAWLPWPWISHGCANRVELIANAIRKIIGFMVFTLELILKLGPVRVYAASGTNWFRLRVIARPP